VRLLTDWACLTSDLSSRCQSAFRARAWPRSGAGRCDHHARRCWVREPSV